MLNAEEGRLLKLLTDHPAAGSIAIASKGIVAIKLNCCLYYDYCVQCLRSFHVIFVQPLAPLSAEWRIILSRPKGHFKQTSTKQQMHDSAYHMQNTKIKGAN